MSSYIFKTTPNAAKVNMTFDIGCNVNKQTLKRTRGHFPVLLSSISYENLHYYPQNLFSESNESNVNNIWLSFMHVIQQNRH